MAIQNKFLFYVGISSMDSSLLTWVEEHSSPQEILQKYGSLTPFEVRIMLECRKHLLNEVKVRVKDQNRDELETLLNYYTLILANFL